MIGETFATMGEAAVITVVVYGLYKLLRRKK